jgi:hypothetical protein
VFRGQETAGEESEAGAGETGTGDVDKGETVSGEGETNAISAIEDVFESGQFPLWVLLAAMIVIIVIVIGLVLGRIKIKK